MGSFDPASVAGIDLAQIPIVGHATGTTRAIYEDGRAIGRDPNVLAKVGDCSTEHWYFLNQFTWGQYDLGEYSALQGVIDRFGESMDYDSQASHNGYNVNSVMDSRLGRSAVCASPTSHRWNANIASITPACRHHVRHQRPVEYVRLRIRFLHPRCGDALPKNRGSSRS